MKDIVIKTDKHTKGFGNFIAANEISFEVYKGEIFGFLGANGAGKTTAMRMLCGLSIPSAGNATIAGYDVYKQTDLIKRNIGYMSQKFSLYDDLTVLENIQFFGGIYGLTDKQLKTKSDALIEQLGYVKFYVFTFVIALPGIVLFWLMMRAGLMDSSMGTAAMPSEDASKSANRT